MAYCMNAGGGYDADGNGVADATECANMSLDNCVWAVIPADSGGGGGQEGAALGETCIANDDCAADLICDENGRCAEDPAQPTMGCICPPGENCGMGGGMAYCMNAGGGYDADGNGVADATECANMSLDNCVWAVIPADTAPTTCIFVDVMVDGVDYAADSADMVQARVCKEQMGEAAIEVKSTCSDSEVCRFSELINCVTSNGYCGDMLATCQAVANTMRDMSCGGDGR